MLIMEIDHRNTLSNSWPGCRQRMPKLTCSSYSFFTILVSKQHLCGHLRGGRIGERGNGKTNKQQMSKEDLELKITNNNKY